MTEEKIFNLLKQHVPAEAVAYCMSLRQSTPFELKTTRRRATKAGDFFCSSTDAQPRITINNDLNPYLFLLTYIHEVAHLHAYHQHGSKAGPHGIEWKLCFQKLMVPVLTPDVFPQDVLSQLLKHMENPKASSFADAELTRVLRTYDQGAHEMITVGELPEGSSFVLRGKHFKKGKLRRTRFLCHEVTSKRQYLVPAEALVNHAQLSLGLFS